MKNNAGIKLNDELKSCLENTGYSQRVLAKRLGACHSYLNDVIKGKKPMNMTLALSLEFSFIKTAEYWLVKQIKEKIKNEKIEDERF